MAPLRCLLQRRFAKIPFGVLGRSCSSLSARMRLAKACRPSYLTRSISIGSHFSLKTNVVGVRFMSSQQHEIQVDVPSMGDSITEGVVSSWVKEAGDFVEADEVVVVLETDKVTIEVRAPVSGTLSTQLAVTGAEVAVGSPLFKIIEGAASTEAAAEPDTEPVTESAAEQAAEQAAESDDTPSQNGGEEMQIDVPSMGDSITEGVLSSWNKATGEQVEADEVVAIIETDKVSIEVRAPVAGTLSAQLVVKDAEVAVGAPLFTLRPGGTSAPKAQPAAAAAAAAPSPPKPASPTPPPPPAQKQQQPAKEPEVASAAGSRGSRRVPLSRMRQRIAQRLKEAQNTAASLTTFNEIDMSQLMKMRSTYKELFAETHDVKLGFMSAFVKASVAGLQEMPAINSYIEGKEVVYHDYCDISVAVATPNGLVVPVLRNCESLSFAGVEKSIAALGRKAREGQIALEDMAGGTFTISNGGVYGSLFGTPILNPPQSAILGMHGIFQRPIAVNGKVEIRPMMYVALTYDHRIVDGREAVMFLRKVKDSIEDPQRLLLQI